jgi:hypothetical protein
VRHRLTTEVVIGTAVILVAAAVFFALVRS